MLLRHTQTQRRGFSLIEMMWQLVILVVVSFPMVMALNMQKQTIEKDETQTRDKVLTNSLFAVTNPNDPDWFHRYTVTSTGPFMPNGSTWGTYTGNQARRLSIYCDTANPALGVDLTNPNNKCYMPISAGTPGENAKRPPFFERSLEMTSDRRLKVTVSLFEKAKYGESAEPFYESSREYDVLPHRMLMSAATVVVQQPREVDEEGTAWFWDRGIESLTNPNATNWSVIRQGAGCSGSETPASALLTGVPFPYQTYLTLSRQEGSCNDADPETDFTQWLAYRFLVPSGAYTVNLHFVVPKVDIGTGCLQNTANMSCSLVDIGLSPSNIATAAADDVKMFPTFDINAAAGPEFTAGVLFTNYPAQPNFTPKPAVFRTTYTTSTGEIWVYVKPTRPDVGGTTAKVYLSGIEIIRKGQ